MIRNLEAYRAQAEIEIELLAFLKDKDVDNTSNVVHLLDHFTFRNHTCLVFELMEGTDLYTALKRTEFRGLELDSARDVTKRLVDCLVGLRRNNIIHCDLKPENVLLRNNHDAELKVIDFGYSCWSNSIIHETVQSSYYRAPEVFMKAPYSFEIDIWSLGCMVFELINGKPLFASKHEKEILMLHAEVIGLPSKKFLSRCRKSWLYFNDERMPRVTNDSKGNPHLPGTRSIQSVLGTKGSPEVCKFIEACLQWDPADRITPEMAARHPFLVGAKASDTKLGVTQVGHTRIRGKSASRSVELMSKASNAAEASKAAAQEAIAARTIKTSHRKETATHSDASLQPKTTFAFISLYLLDNFTLFCASLV